MKSFIFLTTMFIFGCNSIPQIKRMSPDEFEKKSQGKRVFVVGGAIGKYNTIHDFCDEFEQLICSKNVNDFQGKKGFILESKPFIRNRFYLGYHIVMETGEKFVLKLSNVYKDKDPIESALYLIDETKLIEVQSLKGKELIGGLSVNILSQTSYGGVIEVHLSNNEVINKPLLDNRIKFLNDYIKVKDRDKVFGLLNMVNLRYDEFDNKWWVKPKLYANMPLYPYFGIQRGNKWIRLNANYEGFDWVFFNKITVISNGKRYVNAFNNYDVQHDNGNEKVWEWIDILAKESELDIMQTLSKNAGKIKFSGKYESTKDISSNDSSEIGAVLSLYELTKT